MEGNTILNPNPLVKFLNKPQKEFTKADIIRYVTKNDIEMINFRYAGADGLMVEVHNNPAKALCDGPQSLTPEQFDSLMNKVNKTRQFFETL